MKGIAKYQHFRAEKSEPGMVFLKRDVYGAEESMSIFKKDVTPDAVLQAGMPPIIQPEGISQQRRAYLEKEIRQHMPDDVTPPW